MALSPDAFVKVTMVYNAIVIIQLLFYHFNVPMQSVFIRPPYITNSNVPYYVTHLPWGLANPAFTEFGGIYWWMLILDWIRWFYPGMFVILMTLGFVYPIDDLAIFGAVFFAILWLLDLGKFLVRGWEYWFCENFQDCRHWNPPYCATTSWCEPNYMFKWIFWTNFIFLWFGLIYVFFAVYIRDISRVYHETLAAQRELRRDEVRTDRYMSLFGDIVARYHGDVVPQVQRSSDARYYMNKMWW